MITYILETYNKDRAVPYCSCIYKLSRISGKYNRDITAKEYHKYLNDCVVFKGIDCVYEMLDNVLTFKGEVEIVINKIVENNLYSSIHIG